ncbi:catalase [Dermatobacter hominis]|uniref:catalase n=1 Tax=Dermatobacter hominis TaxID=2884263 RepID=UPI001D12AE80|nr:catalase [Dermatobacter hominis]UDY37491.1 catalase [Dermatobacter hominis]
MPSTPRRNGSATSKKNAAAKKAPAKRPTAKKAATSAPPARKAGAPAAGARTASTPRAVEQGRAASKQQTAKKRAAKKSAPRKAAAVEGAARGRIEGRSVQPPEGTPSAANFRPPWAQAGDRLTTAQGLRVDDSDNSLTVAERGPTLLEDHHLREKITHFDHERIPERVVHARGAGAHGTFECTDGLDDVCAAAFLRSGAVTPVFTRFSTVIGSRGSADTVRDVRGFATKFYTEQGNFDLVGNNIPVFFIQDGIKFPDLIHAAKPEPDMEIPQAQTAHDTFWDFVSLQPESTHMLMWAMSDRAIPRSYATMEGFGVHTFRLVAADGSTTLCKWHWKPVAGVHGLVWEEAQKIAGVDPDFHRRDLYDRINSGNAPRWELGVQLMPDTPDQTFEGIDLLDSTKIVPEELCPVRTVGTLTLHTPPANFFEETEQIAFHPGHLVPGIDLVDDPLLHARLFSYLDTQLTRLGGPNFAQIPINRPLASVNDDHRDGFMQQAVHEGIAPYVPNSLGGGCPFASPETAYVHRPQPVEGTKRRVRPQSFDDHYSQATMFFASLTPDEQEHLIGAFRFELGKCTNVEVVSRMVGNLAHVDAELCAQVAVHLGIPAPTSDAEAAAMTSPALSMAPTGPGPVDGRKVAVLVGDDTDPAGLAPLQEAADALGVEVVAIGPRFGELAGGATADRTLHTAASVEFDGVIVATAAHEGIAFFTQEAYRHHKTVGAVGTGDLAACAIDLTAPGVTGDDPDDFLQALALHRHWDRPTLGSPGG